MFEVLVGNIGRVYHGGLHRDALDVFTTYKKQSKQNIGRAAGESVTLMEDGEPILEHVGHNEHLNAQPA